MRFIQRIPVDEALPIAKQIAEALEAAHEAGVIHRDLKPANIKVKPDGTVKVLDFGLAKAFQPDSGSDPAESRTVTAATQQGVILGTAAYMSPEQASGQATDRRSDLWAFGVVLFELLTGRRLFEGVTASHVVAKVLEGRIDLNALPPETPASLRRLVRRCLEREARRRLRDSTEALIHIEDAKLELDVDEREPDAATARRPHTWWRAALAVGTLAMGATAIALVFQTREDLAPREVTRLEVSLQEGQLLSPRGGLALSPDGRTLVYSAGGRDDIWGTRLYRRDMNQLGAEEIWGTEGALAPFFSPDGTSVGFFSGREVKRVSLDGGIPVSLARARTSGGGAWASDDTIFFTSRDNPGLSRLSAMDGGAETTVESSPAELRWPQPLPGAEAVLFSTRVDPPEDARIEVQLLGTGERRFLTSGTTPRYAPSGHLVFTHQGSLWAAAFDLERLQLAGEPIEVVDSVYVNPSTGQAFYALGGDGSLAYVRGLDAYARRTMVCVDPNGNEEPIRAPSRAYWWPRVSPDGTRVGVHVMDTANMDVHVHDLVTGITERTTDHAAIDQWLFWTPQGDRFVFGSRREPPGINIFVRPVDGTGTASV